MRGGDIRGVGPQPAFFHALRPYTEKMGSDGSDRRLARAASFGGSDKVGSCASNRGLKK